MNITQIVPMLKMVSSPVAGVMGLVVTLLTSELVIRTRDDDICLDLFR